MVTEEQLETVLRDFISNCKGIGVAYDTHCLKCRYHSVCDRLIVWESNAPCDWEFYPKEESDDNSE